MERLQKIISAAGVASRRKAEELITSGLVQVNGQTVTELGTKADAGKDHIRVDGKLLKFSDHHVYILLNKPKGYVTTLSDPEGRPTILDLLRGVKARVYPVGRLDYASEGLLLLTNDGELANALTKAASHVPKTYLIKVSGQPSDAAIEQLRAGIELPDRKGIHSRTAPAGIQLVHKAENPWYEVTLIEGRNRQVRAMFEQTGHHVEKLKRVRYGPFTLDVHPGKFRNLLPEEVEQLRAAIKRGTGATVEAAVHPIERKESHIEAELREEARSPVKFQPSPTLPDKPKRTPKPLGVFVPKARVNSSRPERTRPVAFRDSDFRKKSPHTSKFRRDSTSFQKRADENNVRPSRASSTGEGPAWKKPDPARSNSPAAGAPRKWTQGAPQRTGRPPARDQRRPDKFRPSASRVRDDASPYARGAIRETNTSASSPSIRPRPDNRSTATSDRPVRSNQRPDWKKPGSFRSNAPTSFGPRKWTNNAPSPKARAAASDRPKSEGFQRNTSGPLTDRLTDRPRPNRPPTDRPQSDRPRPAANRPGTPRFKEERSGTTGGAVRPARTGARPNRDDADPRQPFWKSADKRRPRKEAAEGDSETRPVEHRERSASAKPGKSKFAPSRTNSSKFKPSRPNKNRR
jgi:23S rRNA pseudouridine2605 synthase